MRGNHITTAFPSATFQQTFPQIASVVHAGDTWLFIQVISSNVSRIYSESDDRFRQLGKAVFTWKRASRPSGTGVTGSFCRDLVSL